MMDITIRVMEERDLDEVCRMEEEAFSMPWHRESFLEMIKNENACYLVAETATKEVIGCCGVLNIVGDGNVTNVVVDSRMRGKGVGRQLMVQLLEAGKQLGIEAFTLEVREGNEQAIALYTSLGFENVGIRKNFYEKPVENAIIMWKR